jgi:hypothetical protein
VSSKVVGSALSVVCIQVVSLCVDRGRVYYMRPHARCDFMLHLIRTSTQCYALYRLRERVTSTFTMSTDTFPVVTVFQQFLPVRDACITVHGRESLFNAQVSSGNWKRSMLCWHAVREKHLGGNSDREWLHWRQTRMITPNWSTNIKIRKCALNRIASIDQETWC